MRRVGLVLLCLLTFVVGLGQSAITDSDEAFYAESGREMVVSGDWVTPHYNFEPRLQKPILFYWLIAATYRVTGVTEWSARLWSGLAGLGLALVAAAISRRWSPRGRGTLAGVIVATSFGVVPLARQALPDVPLAFFVTVTIWAAIEALTVLDVEGQRALGRQRRSRWLYLSAAAAGLGMLTKGPVALALPVTVLVPLLWWERRWGGAKGAPVPVGLRALGIAALVFVFVAAPWYLAVMRAQGLDYARQFFVGENVERFATSTYNAWRGWEYIPVIIAGLLPWSAFFVLWIRPVNDWLRRRRRLSAVEARLIAWAGGPLAFFFVSVGSQPRYILPCLVPLAVLLARTIADRAAVQGEQVRDGFLAAALGAGAMIVLAGVLLWRAARVLDVDALVAMGPVVMMIIGGTAMLGVAAAPRRAVTFVLGSAAALSLLVFQSSLLAPGRPEPVETMAAAVRAERSTDALCACGAFARTLVLYTGMKTESANVTPERTEELEDFLARPSRVLAAVDARALTNLEKTKGVTYPRVAEVTYLNLHEWQRGEMLVRPDPSWRQHVILIANR